MTTTTLPCPSHQQNQVGELESKLGSIIAGDRHFAGVVSACGMFRRGRFFGQVLQRDDHGGVQRVRPASWRVHGHTKAIGDGAQHVVEAQVEGRGCIRFRLWRWPQQGRL